jgi:hypothetical protein
VLREIRMLGPRSGVVKAKGRLVAVLFGLVLAGGCFWREYPGLLAVHTDVLVGVARKARDLLLTGRFDAENLAEVRYPFDRASAFAADAHRRLGSDPAPRSLVAFDALLQAYAAYLERVERVRRGEGGAEAEPPPAALAAALAPVESAARDVTDALAHER